ncbi:hypothetical protein F5Y04DRAFT_285795 [Hypomontagnella monticulosa]|nr:hypothetical protein F5Y04DRAFT_285795 [Hypomontagnella monticulosa]
MTEVKDFERHLRFKKYLAKAAKDSDNDFGNLPIRTKKAPTAQKSIESIQSGTSQPASEAPHKGSPAAEVKDSPRLLEYPPRRLPKSGGNSAESSSQDNPSSSQSGTSGSANTADPTGWGNLPMTLPPPFSRDTRNVSDAQSLPSTGNSIRTQPRLGDTSQEPPMTPPRRSSLRAVQDETLSSSLSLSSGRRPVGSMARFVESIEGSPSRSSPTPLPHVSSSNLSSFTRRDELEPRRRPEHDFTIYDDTLPASSQPQTPRNLPEARHRSRLHGSYTAPQPRLESQSAYESSTERGGGDDTSGPSGLDTPGFRGLYGGRENGEDSTLFHEASRFWLDDSVEDDRG